MFYGEIGNFLDNAGWIFESTVSVLLDDLEQVLKEGGYNKIKATKDYIYAPGKIPVMLVAHVDTVHYKEPSQIFVDQAKGIAWSPQGIGADDRAGILGILELLHRGYRPHILFTDGEEKGGRGASAAAKDLTLPQVHMVIELDRRGSDDAVFYGCDNKDFWEYIEKFGFKKDTGSFSDISIVCPAWNVAGVNLSTGYYGAHTTGEMLSLPELEATVNRVEEILKKLPTKKFKYTTKPKEAPKTGNVVGFKTQYGTVYGAKGGVIQYGSNYRQYDYGARNNVKSPAKNYSKRWEDWNSRYYSDEYVDIGIDILGLVHKHGFSYYYWSRLIEDNMVFLREIGQDAIMNALLNMAEEDQNAVRNKVGADTVVDALDDALSDTELNEYALHNK